MAPTLTQDRRVAVFDDRRRIMGRGGRRAEDRATREMTLLIPCVACGVAWAHLVSLERQSLATYLCPRCGDIENRATGADSARMLKRNWH
jgi:hypothetical protein